MMNAGDLAILAWCDLGGILRTRPVPLDQLEAKRQFGVGFAAAGTAITPFDGIVDNPFGPLDEVRMVPVENASVVVPQTADVPAMHLHLTRTLDASGALANYCPRNFCESALSSLERETGWTLWSAFEHEFTVKKAPFLFGAVYSVESVRLAARFAHDMAAALRPLELECFEPEFGKGQFEVSCAPLPGVAGPDRAILTREVIREIARRHGVTVTLAPKPTLDAASNGMHVHFSFRDRDDKPALYDPSQPATVTPMAASFISGIIRHMDAVTAVSAPTPASYLRLGPSHWSCGYAAFGVQNREAALRVCPSPNREPLAAAAATNLELRTPDGTCNPYLAIGVLALAGLQGIRDKRPLPAIVDRDPATLTRDERAALQVRPLPTSLAEAIDALESDDLAKLWMPKYLHQTFINLKRMEISRFASSDPSAIAHAYGNLY
jgi:glutamine synthetase